MTKKINPLKVIRVTLNVIGYTLVGLMFGVSVLVAAAAAIVNVWPYWGAWAITVPFLFVIGLAALGMLFAYIGYQFDRFGYWYRAKETRWNNKHIHNVTDD